MKRSGEAMRVLGIAIILFSYFILFMVVEPIIGMERIVGKENVIRDSTGGFAYTNSISILLWTFTIAFVGLLVNRIGALADPHPPKS
jgi:hypothetical protein